MKLAHRSLAALAAIALFAPIGMAQDSVAKLPCLGGDATSPWDDSTALNGSEQCDDFVVDLNPFATCWGTEFGIAPLLKSSKTTIAFNTSQVSAQGISATQTSVTTSTLFDVWAAPGVGVNNDPAIHDAPATIAAPCNMKQFGVVFSEFGTTDGGQSYGGIIGARVAYQPNNPSRLYVSRTVAAVNSCNPISNLASLAAGSVSADGEVFFRADGFGTVGGCGLTSLLPSGANNNIFSVNLAARDCDILDVISDDTPGLKDTGALSHYVVNSATAHTTPGHIGTGKFYAGVNFNNEFVRGAPGLTTATAAHLPASISATRGNLAWSPDNFGLLGSTAGLCSVIGENSLSGLKDQLVVWGVNAAGGVTGNLAAGLPPSITDNNDGFVTLPPAGSLQFDHYHSQVAFQGGNGQVALRVDGNGDLLVAAVLDHPQDGGTTWPVNAIGVCRINASTGAQSWTLAAWNDGASGKALLDGPGGNPKGNLVPLNLVTGGTPLGPSMSSPMFDAKGNVWFLSALHTDADDDFATGLVRAVYDPTTDGYELDLVMKTGQIFHGENSTRDYLITFLGIADSNSVSSGSAWSGNMSAGAHGGGSAAGLAQSDPRANGGLVISAGIIYDTNDDGDFTSCFNGGVDEQYNVLLYVGHCAWNDVGGAKANALNVKPSMTIKGNMSGGSVVTVDLANMTPAQNLFIVVGLTGIFAPFKGGTLVPNPDLVLPALPTFAGNLTLPAVWPAGLPPCFDLYFQTWITGPGITGQFSATNGVQGQTAP